MNIGMNVGMYIFGMVIFVIAITIATVVIRNNMRGGK